jgi:hypothetical protein
MLSALFGSASLRVTWIGGVTTCGFSLPAATGTRVCLLRFSHSGFFTLSTERGGIGAIPSLSHSGAAKPFKLQRLARRAWEILGPKPDLNSALEKVE